MHHRRESCCGAADRPPTLAPVGSPRMHPDQVPTDAALVHALLAEQYPRWAGLPVHLVASSGTDHDVYRLGEHLAARLPKIGWAEGQAAVEAAWLPRLAPHLPLAVPVVVAHGRPGRGYPFAWSVQQWLPGRSADPAREDAEPVAADLAAFVLALRSSAATGAPVRGPGRRGGPLAALDDDVRAAVAQLGDRVDGPAVLRCWQQAVEAPPAQGPPVLLHGDLLPGNVLVDGDRPSAVIDWGGFGAGDPAVDLQPAWNLLTGAARRRFRRDLGADDAVWARGRGVVVHQTVQALPYYWRTNPGMVAQASRALSEVVADRG